MYRNIEYLTLLKEQYPTIASACAEIIALEAQEMLPKLTEHFMSDIHGEHEDQEPSPGICADIVGTDLPRNREHFTTGGINLLQ